jgi:hypothetical protein
MKKFRLISNSSLAAIAAIGFCSVYGWAEDPAINQSLNQIEDRLLDKDYHTDSDEKRLERLENFVFGGPETGTVKERVARLSKALAPAAVDEQPGSDTAKAKVAAAAPTSAQKAAPHYDSSDYGTYPRVAELEQQVFGKTFITDPLPVRVSRLETKEFGHSSDNADLADRMDRLDKLLAPASPLQRPTVAQTGQAQGPGPSQVNFNPYPSAAYGGSGGDDGSAKPAIENPFAPGSPDVKSIEQRTSSLEKFVFGHEHFGKPLAERVARLEKKLVPYEHHTDKDLPTRVDHLWTMLAAANAGERSPVAAQ